MTSTTDPVKIGLDTNILIYASGLNDDARFRKANAILIDLAPLATIIPTQAMGEFFVASQRLGRTANAAAVGVEEWYERYDIVAATPETFAEAFKISASNNLQFWDALILATAAEAGCRMLLSEDMQHGFVWKGCTVINPFAEPMHPLLADTMRA